MGLNLGNNEKKMKIAKMPFLGIGIAVLMVSAGLIALSPKSGGNLYHQVKPLRVACIGDSITEGSGYPNNLQMLLGTNYAVGNFGVSGSTVSLKSGKPYMNQTAFQKAKAFQPDIVIIMLGTNDANPAAYQYLESTAYDYKQLIAEFQALPGSQEVWLVQPPPIFNNGPGPNNTNLVQGVIPTIRQVATDLNLSTIDVYTAMANYPEYFPDGVHPDNEGAKVIATNVYEAITFADDIPFGASDIVFLG
jgi:lysophospholipase L1-like esterase